MLETGIRVPEHFRFEKQRVGGIDPIFAAKVVLYVDVFKKTFFDTVFFFLFKNTVDACLESWKRHRDPLRLIILRVCRVDRHIYLRNGLKCF